MNKWQQVMDSKATTYAKYEWHIHGMQTNKTPLIKSKGGKNNFLPFKFGEKYFEKIIKKKINEIAIRTPIFSLLLYAKLDTMWPVYRCM